MNVDFPFICDYAQVVADKTNALGIGFDTVYSQKVPVKHPMFHLVVQLRAAFVEAGTKDMEVHLIDAGGVDTTHPIISRSAWSLAPICGIPEIEGNLVQQRSEDSQYADILLKLRSIREDVRAFFHGKLEVNSRRNRRKE